MMLPQNIAITKNMPMSSLGMLGIKKPMLQSKRPFFHKTLFWKILIWLFVGSCLLVIASSEARAAACAGGECHVRSTTIDFTVSSDDLTASTVVVGWVPYVQINGSAVTVNYPNPDSDETVGNPPNVDWVAGPLYPTQGSGGAITQTHTFHGVQFNPPSGFCASSITKTIGLAHVTITDSAGNQTTTDFLIIYDCDQAPPSICRSGGGPIQCDTGCAGLACSPTPLGLGDSKSIYGYCTGTNSSIYLTYILYCVKADGSLKAVEPPYQRYGAGYPGTTLHEACDANLTEPDTKANTPDDIYLEKTTDTNCQTYEIRACQAVGPSDDCAWYKWRYTFNIQPWLKVKGGSLRSEGNITLGNTPPAGECNATYTISAKGTFTSTAQNNNCSNVAPVGDANVKGDVTSGQTFTKSSRGVIDIASILKGRFGKVVKDSSPSISFDTIKNYFDTYNVVVLDSGSPITINIGSADIMNNAVANQRGNKTILAQNDLTLASSDGSLSYQAGNVTSPNQLASLGWIVQKPNFSMTNLTIQPGLSNLAGVFYVNGDIHTGDTLAKALTVQGAMITSSLGRFYFERNFASASVASETIWDDGRAWLNPPPGFINILSGLPHSTSLQVSPNN